MSKSARTAALTTSQTRASCTRITSRFYPSVPSTEEKKLPAHRANLGEHLSVPTPWSSKSSFRPCPLPCSPCPPPSPFHRKGTTELRPVRGLHDRTSAPQGQWPRCVGSDLKRHPPGTQRTDMFPAKLPSHNHLSKARMEEKNKTPSLKAERSALERKRGRR